MPDKSSISPLDSVVIPTFTKAGHTGLRGLALEGRISAPRVPLPTDDVFDEIIDSFSFVSFRFQAVAEAHQAQISEVEHLATKASDSLSRLRTHFRRGTVSRSAVNTNKNCVLSPGRIAHCGRGMSPGSVRPPGDGWGGRGPGWRQAPPTGVGSSGRPAPGAPASGSCCRGC